MKNSLNFSDILSIGVVCALLPISLAELNIGVTDLCVAPELHQENANTITPARKKELQQVLIDLNANWNKN